MLKFGEDQLRAGSHLGSDLRKCKELGHELACALPIALLDSGLGFGKPQLEGRFRGVRVLEEVFDRSPQTFSQDLQDSGRGSRLTQFDLVQVSAAEVLLGNGGQAEPQFHSRFANAGAHLLRSPRTPDRSTNSNRHVLPPIC